MWYVYSNKNEPDPSEDTEIGFNNQSTKRQNIALRAAFKVYEHTQLHYPIMCKSFFHHISTQDNMTNGHEIRNRT